MQAATLESTPLERIPAAARTVLRLLGRLPRGHLRLRLPDGRQVLAGRGFPAADIAVQDWEVFACVLRDGDNGFADAYLAGRWTTTSLPALFAVLLLNRDALDAVVYGTWWGRLAARVRHALNRNTKAGSRRNIHAHYDLGNDFYRLWLDATMNYSSGLFEGEDHRPLEAAQRAKMRRALDAVALQPGGRLLEIGCGWGALAEMAVEEFRADVTGVTLSPAQLRYAQARVGEHADLRLQDYRDIEAPPFDAICSIEMCEAVGREYWPLYFSTVARLLKPGGRACIQSIVIRDSLWRRYASGSDFIQQYIFPGGCLPCPAEFEAHARGAGLRVDDCFSFGSDYARTLRMWRANFHASIDGVTALGFDDRFVRLWDFYLCYCEAAFDNGDIDVLQYTLAKP